MELGQRIRMGKVISFAGAALAVAGLATAMTRPWVCAAIVIGAIGIYVGRGLCTGKWLEF